ANDSAPPLMNPSREQDSIPKNLLADVSSESINLISDFLSSNSLSSTASSTTSSTSKVTSVPSSFQSPQAPSYPSLQSPSIKSPLQSPSVQSPSLQSPSVQSPLIQSPSIQSPALLRSNVSQHAPTPTIVTYDSRSPWQSNPPSQ